MALPEQLWGTLIANVYNWIITLRRIGSHMELPARKVLPFPYYLKVLGTAAITAIPVWYTRTAFIPEESVVTGLFYSLIIYLFLFSIAGTAFRVITEKDWKQFREWAMLKFLYRNEKE
jgi:hypothetical protein